MSGITEAEFARFQHFILDAAGISLAPSKKTLVASRLATRLRQLGLDSYGAYLDLLKSGASSAEVQTAIDRLTTNETYFFREPKHFDFLRARATASRGRTFRVWSAASSSGEEPYSIAMVLADCLGDGDWAVTASDISMAVLARARRGHYPMSRAAHIPATYLKRFCLKGSGPEAGTLLVKRSLRERVAFLQVNLNAALPTLGSFDVIFLRNVMIYFDAPTKRAVVERLVPLLHPGGHFLVGHSETLHGVTDALQAIAPAIYLRH